MAARHVSWRCLRALWSDCRDKLRLLKSLRDGRVVCRVGVLTVGMTRLMMAGRWLDGGCRRVSNNIPMLKKT